MVEVQNQLKKIKITNPPSPPLPKWGLFFPSLFEREGRRDFRM
jgi:hypothetical protein